ncbi:MAG: tetratricopeptide repeat protein [Spirochaetaceae bacterium]|nr:tetratricopeptide repeat protein [Spirochaetaceae bacterium]
MKKAILTSLCILLLGTSFCFAEPTAADRGYAADEFRRGVQSYYRGAYNDSILLFEKALSYLPNDPTILEWLGYAYYQSGIEGAAIQYWEDALKNNYKGNELLLQNQIDIVKERRVGSVQFEGNAHFVEAGAFPGKDGDKFYYSQPVSVLPEKNGECWVLAYGSNELLHFDANGLMIERIRGPMNGFDRPMDIIRKEDGTLLISEYAGDRISVLTKDGKFVRTFGSKGRKTGELLGPQYMALDSSENIYVSDFGNARIDVFNSEGEGLFSFGRPVGDFEGLSAPSGVAVVNDVVYVADSTPGTVYMFDTAGNYLDVLVPKGTFVRPEALKKWQNYLLVADSNHIFAVDISNGAVFEAASTGNAPSRLTCAVPDMNGNLLATDFKTNEVLIMSKMPELVGGLAVQVVHVDSSNFPTVTMDIRVENRQHQPVVGLDDPNFLVTEKKRPVNAQTLTGIASLNDICDVAVLVDRSMETAEYKEALQSAVRDIAKAMNGKGTMHLISVSNMPVLEQSDAPQKFLNFVPSQLKAPNVEQPAVDLGVRLAVNKLVTGEKKRGIIYISAGTIAPNAFNSYGLTDLSAYLNNNGVSFFSINLSRNQLAPELTFLANQTSGKDYYIFRPDGISMIIEDMLDVPVGYYQIQYQSSMPTNFGRDFIPVEVEAYLLNRSGRTETGYFAPLE